MYVVSPEVVPGGNCSKTSRRVAFNSRNEGTLASELIDMWGNVWRALPRAPGQLHADAQADAERDGAALRNPGDHDSFLLGRPGMTS